MSPPGTNEYEQAARCWEKAQTVRHWIMASPFRGEKLRSAEAQAAAWELGAKAWERAGKLALEKEDS